MSFIFRRVSRPQLLPSVYSKSYACLRGTVHSKNFLSSTSKNSEYSERLVPPIYVKTPPAWVRYAWPIVIANALIMYVQ